jgi:isopenicillin N synthase-like dioxygenase
VTKQRLDHIPVVDVAPAYDGSPETVDALAGELVRTLEAIGFAYISGHTVSPELITGLNREAKTFFARPMAEKQAIAINRWHRGYMAPNSSLIVTSSIAEVAKPNQSESVLIMHELAPDDPDVIAGKPLQGPNQWPAAQPTLRDAALGYMAALEELARRVVHLIARGLGLDETHFDPHFRRPTTFLRLLHYPPQPKQDGLFGSAPHTDYGFITLLAQDDRGGLEVRGHDGAWIAAPPIAGTFVLNVGDILSRWSNGRLASTPHRVINLSGADRYSQPFFFDPAMECVVSPLAECIAAGADPAYPPVRYGDYLMERIDKNYDYRKDKTA